MYIVFKCSTHVALFIQKKASFFFFYYYTKVPFRDPMGSHFRQAATRCSLF